jgi:hypothetical protein
MSMMVAAAAVTLSLATAQDNPKREGKRSRAQENAQPSAPAAQPSQDTQGPSRVPRNQFVNPQTADRPPMGDQQGRGRPGSLHPFAPRAGDWLRQYKNVPVDQQERALTNDPSFQKLPADRQEKLRERLRQFNALPPEKQDRLLDRMEKFETLPQEKRQRLRGIQERLRQLPDDRQQKVRHAFHQLKGMSAEQRQSYLGSDRFQSLFTPEEQEILRGLNEIEGTPELAEPADPRKND